MRRHKLMWKWVVQLFVVAMGYRTLRMVYKQWGPRSPSSGLWKSKIKVEASESGAASEE